jgi:hypothetical protein
LLHVEGASISRKAADMNLDSYTLGARVDTPLHDSTVSIEADATFKADSGALDGARVRVQFGDSSPPKMVESTTTQAWTMADGSVRQIEMPRFSSERLAQGERTRVSVAATLTGSPTAVSASSSPTLRPSVTVAVGTNGQAVASTVRASLGSSPDMLETSITLGRNGFGAVKGTGPIGTTAAALKDNNDALRGAVIVRP